MSRFGIKTRLTGIGASAYVRNWMGYRFLRSVQRGIITLSSIQTTNTATITSVDTNNSRLIYLGTSTNGGTAETGETVANLVLTNATTITATRGLLDTATTIVSYEISEYWPGVMRSVQRGTVQSLNTATITAVNTAKSTIDCTGILSTVTTGDTSDSCAYLDLTNSTTVTATRNTNTDTLFLGYQVIEWW